MNTYVILLVIFLILFLLFIPIPIKLRLNFNNFKFRIFIYSFELKRKNKYKPKKNKKSKVHKRKKIKINFKKLLHNLFNLKYKISVNINYFFKYGFGEADKTALSFTMFKNIDSLIKLLLNKVFNIKSYSSNIVPEFNEKIIKFEFHSIIKLNLAKIIYISYKIIRSLEFTKEEIKNGKQRNK